MLTVIVNNLLAIDVKGATITAACEEGVNAIIINFYVPCEYKAVVIQAVGFNQTDAVNYLVFYHLLFGEIGQLVPQPFVVVHIKSGLYILLHCRTQLGHIYSFCCNLTCKFTVILIPHSNCLDSRSLVDFYHTFINRRIFIGNRTVKCVVNNSCFPSIFDCHISFPAFKKVLCLYHRRRPQAFKILALDKLAFTPFLHREDGNLQIGILKYPERTGIFL